MTNLLSWFEWINYFSVPPGMVSEFLAPRSLKMNFLIPPWWDQPQAVLLVQEVITAFQGLEINQGVITCILPGSSSTWPDFLTLVALCPEALSQTFGVSRKIGDLDAQKIILGCPKNYVSSHLDVVCSSKPFVKAKLPKLFFQARLCPVLGTQFP